LCPSNVGAARRVTTFAVRVPARVGVKSKSKKQPLI
jgi:hypothetical protein